MNDLAAPAVTASELSRRHALAGVAAITASFVAAGSILASSAGAQERRIPPASDGVTPFRVSVPQRKIDDLKARLRMARLRKNGPTRFITLISLVSLSCS